MTSHAVITGRHAQLYDRVVAQWLLGRLYARVADALAASVPSGGAVLDVGTGPGRLLVELARRRPDLHLAGVDPSADMVAHAEQRLQAAGLRDRVEVRVGSAEVVPFPEGSFDAVVSTLSAHHWADTAAALTDQARVLRPGGRVWVYDLRRSASAVTAALHAALPGADVERPELGRLGSLLLAAYRAGKPADAT